MELTVKYNKSLNIFLRIKTKITNIFTLTTFYAILFIQNTKLTY